MSGAILFALGLFSLLLATNVVWPRFSPTFVTVVSFFASWLSGELAPHVVVGEAAVAALLVWRGALGSWLGVSGFLLLAIAIALQLLSLVVSYRTARIVDHALDALGAPTLPARKGDRDWLQLLFPLPVRDRRVARTSKICYFADDKERLFLDIFRARASTDAARPILLYVHGGGWSISDKRWEGLPILLRLAAHGWLGASANYRLSPRATFPDQIIDVKRAIAWVRAHAAEYGGDPDMIFIAGGSSGGHLASLAALTAAHRAWQPGFEDVDTSVAGCVSGYGIYDLTDVRATRHNPGLARLLERHVLKVKEAEHPGAFIDASPIHWVERCNAVPPFLVIHGVNDVLIPVATARAFFAELRRVGSVKSAYIELPLAQHAFEIFPSLRSLAVIKGVERFVEHVRRQRRSALQNVQKSE